MREADVMVETIVVMQRYFAHASTQRQIADADAKCIA